jgi:bacterioferritin-associated ferredoxin
MYVCICNALTDTMVREAIDAGADAPDHVYAHHGCAAVCGRCKPMMQSEIDGAYSGDLMTSPHSVPGAENRPMASPAPAE